MTEAQRTDDSEPETGTPAETSATTKDSESDPGLDDGTTADWTEEGGAMPSGPATDPEAG